MSQRNLTVILLAFFVSVLCHFTYRQSRTASIVGEAIELIERNYVDPVERRDLIAAAMDGMVAKLDQHSSYFPVDAFADFQDSIQQEFAGIGIFIAQPDENQPVRVVTPLVGSPALQAGILPNDRIVKVDGEDVSSLPISEVSARLKGTPGTRVSLVLRRADGEEIPLTVQRARIELESVVGDHRNEQNEWVYRLESDPSVAYIRLKSFGEKTVRELREVLKALDNDFEALVLDVRSNGGGLLYAARDVCDMFLSQGTIVSTRVRGGEMEESFSANPGTLVDPSIPMAVLIDGNSASASEIVAACLQDQGRALVVGTRSFGKGTVQEIMPLEYGRSALRLTVARYYRPNNENIHRAADATEEDEWGVKPDEGFVIPLNREQLMNLSERWQAASFPFLAGIDPPDVQPTELEAPAVDPPQALPEQTDGQASPGDQESPGSRANPAKGADPDPSDEDRDLLSEDLFESEDRQPSPAAKANIVKGPEALEYDPPLRAAVGELLGGLGIKGQDLQEQDDDAEASPEGQAESEQAESEQAA
jgi:carboxyl-terminal processing protease